MENSTHDSNVPEAIEIDHNLIEETRNLLRNDFETMFPSNSESRYSRIHYDEIMDKNNPFICWRYLLHCNRDPKESYQLMKTCLEWSVTFGYDTLGPKSFVKEFWLEGPIVRAGMTRDKTCDVLYIIGKSYHKAHHSVKHLVRQFVAYLIKDWEKQHMNDLRQLVLVFDVRNSTMANIDLDQMAWFVAVRDLNPARYKAILVPGVPFLLRPVVKLIVSWLPEKFTKIIHFGTFEELVEPLIDKDCLPSEAGGTGDKWRLAPREAPWLGESEAIDEDTYKKVRDSFSFSLSKERIEQLREMQIEHERQSADGAEQSGC